MACSGVTKARSTFTMSTGKRCRYDKRRVARTEVVDGQLHTELLEILEHVYRRVAVVDEDALGQLERELLSRPMVPLEDSGRRLRRGPAQRAAEPTGSRRRPVSRVLSRSTHTRAWRTASSSTHWPMRTIRPGLFGDADELRGQHQTPLGMAPPQQRLDPDDPSGAEHRPSAGSAGTARRVRQLAAARGRHVGARWRGPAGLRRRPRADHVPDPWPGTSPRRRAATPRGRRRRPWPARHRCWPPGAARTRCASSG